MLFSHATLQVLGQHDVPRVKINDHSNLQMRRVGMFPA